MGSELGAMRGLVRIFVVGVALGGLIGVNDVAVAGAAEWTVGQARPAFVTAALRHRPGGWHREPTPAGVEAYLVAVDAWRGGAWAIGWRDAGTPDLSLRWNGEEWRRVLTDAV